MILTEEHKLAIAAWASEPAFCPFCGSAWDIRTLDEWNATSQIDKENHSILMEYQCHAGLCQGRSFWA